jgi:hypothetical protein
MHVHEHFREVRAFAWKREWSLAETFRRGAELLLQVYPDQPAVPLARHANWRTPLPVPPDGKA